MSMTRRDKVQTITRDWGVTPVDGWQAAVKEELRALYAREKPLEAVADIARELDDYDWSALDGVDHTGELMSLIGGLIDAADALDAYDKENPR